MRTKHRGEPRFSVSQLVMQVQGETAAGPFYGIVSNLSLSGCFFLTYAPVKFHEIVRAQILLPTERWLSIKGEVLHQVARVGFGVRFLSLSAEEKALLELVLEYALGLNAEAELSTGELCAPPQVADGSRPAERRRHSRVEPLDATGNRDQPATTPSAIENISMGGLFFRTAALLTVSQIISLRLPIGNELPIVVRVEVMHTQPNRGFGARFLWQGENDLNRRLLAREMTLQAKHIS